MKIALISPKGSFLSRDPKFRKFWENTYESTGYRFFWSGFGLGLLTIAALLPKKNVKAKLIDENFEEIDFDAGYDMVAITAITQQATRAYEIAEAFKLRGAKVILGGIHPTLMPHEAKKHSDSVVIGEGENSWPRLVKDFLQNNLQPFYENKNIVDITKSPNPRFDLLNPKFYKMGWIQTTRGCPVDCEFCAASKIFGSKFRHKKIRQVVNEIKSLTDLLKGIHVNFSDDNMFVDKIYSVDIVNALIPLNIRWTAQTDISIANHDKLLKNMKKSGCEILFIGFESLSKANLDSVDRYKYKSRNLDRYSWAIRKIQSYGIGVMGAFIVGFDNDKPNIFKQTTDFIIENNLFGAQITVLTPLPGTRLQMRMEKEERITSYDWSRYTGWDVNFIPKKMSAKTLQNGLLNAYKRIYSPVIRLQKAKHFKKIFSKKI